MIRKLIRAASVGLLLSGCDTFDSERRRPDLPEGYERLSKGLDENEKAALRKSQELPDSDYLDSTTEQANDNSTRAKR